MTAIELALLPIAEVYAGAMFWPIERATEVLTAYAAWADALPDEVTTAGRVMQFPPFPAVPEPLRGKAFAIVEAVVIGDEAHGAELVAPMRALEPAMDTVALVPAPSITTLHMDPPQPVPGASDGTMLREVTDETVEAMVAAAGVGAGSPLLSVELRQLGGALARRAPGNGAAAALDGAYALYAVGMAPTPGAAAAVHDHVDGLLEAMAPWTAERTYFNFTERAVGDDELHDAGTVARLRAVKAAVDPDELFRVVHPIRPA